MPKKFVLHYEKKILRPMKESATQISRRRWVGKRRSPCRYMRAQVISIDQYYINVYIKYNNILCTHNNNNNMFNGLACVRVYHRGGHRSSRRRHTTRDYIIRDAVGTMKRCKKSKIKKKYSHTRTHVCVI